MKFVLASIVCIFLVACGSSNNLNGIYTCKGGIAHPKIELHTDGTGYYSNEVIGKVAIEYKVDRDNLIIKFNGMPIVMTINKDGTITGSDLADNCTKN